MDFPFTPLILFPPEVRVVDPGRDPRPKGIQIRIQTDPIIKHIVSDLIKLKPLFFFQMLVVIDFRDLDLDASIRMLNLNPTPLKTWRIRIPVG